MDSSANVLKLDLRDNDELKTTLGGKQPGDRVTLEFDIVVRNVTDDAFEGNIDAIYTDGGSDEDETAYPDAESPVMVVMVKGKGKKPKKDNESDVSDTEELSDEDPFV